MKLDMSEHEYERDEFGKFASSGGGGSIKAPSKTGDAKMDSRSGKAADASKAAEDASHQLEANPEQSGPFDDRHQDAFDAHVNAAEAHDRAAEHAEDYGHAKQAEYHRLKQLYHEARHGQLTGGWIPKAKAEAVGKFKAWASKKTR